MIEETRETGLDMHDVYFIACRMSCGQGESNPHTYIYKRNVKLLPPLIAST